MKTVIVIGDNNQNNQNQRKNSYQQPINDNNQWFINTTNNCKNQPSNQSYHNQCLNDENYDHDHHQHQNDGKIFLNPPSILACYDFDSNETSQSHLSSLSSNSFISNISNHQNYRSYPNLLTAIKHNHYYLQQQHHQNQQSEPRSKPQSIDQMNKRLNLSSSSIKCHFINNHTTAIDNKLFERKIGEQYLPQESIKKRSYSFDVIDSFLKNNDNYDDDYLNNDNNNLQTKTTTTNMTMAIKNNKKHLDSIKHIESMTDSSSSLSSSTPSSSTYSMLDVNRDHHGHHHQQQHQINSDNNNNNKHRTFIWTYPFIGGHNCEHYRSSLWSKSCVECVHSHECNHQSKKSYGLIRSFGCCLLIILIAIILLSLSIVLGFSLYLAIVTNFLSEQTFAYGISGNFRVVSGDTFTIRLLNQTSMEFRRKSLRYERIMEHILRHSLLSDSLLHTEIFTFRHGSLVVFFRFYTQKLSMDQILSIQKSKTIINFGTIENVLLDDQIISAKIRQTLLHSFRQQWFNASTTITTMNNVNALSLENESIKLSHLERLTEQQYRQRLKHRMNMNEEMIDRIDKQFQKQQTLQELAENQPSMSLAASSPPATTTTTTSASTMAATFIPNIINQFSSNESENVSQVFPIEITTTTASAVNSPLDLDDFEDNNINNDENITKPTRKANIMQISDTTITTTTIPVNLSSQIEFTTTSATTTTKTPTSTKLSIQINQIIGDDSIMNNSTTIQPGVLESIEENNDDEVDYFFDDSNNIYNQSNDQTNNQQQSPVAHHDATIDGFHINLYPTVGTVTEDKQNTTTDKILILSNDSFDLYSVRNHTNISTSLETNDHDDDQNDDEYAIEDEFKLKPTLTNSSVEIINKTDNFAAIIIIENETTTTSSSESTTTTTLPSTRTPLFHPPIPVLTYGTRLSKKLLNNRKQNSSHENNSLHGSFYYYNSIDKIPRPILRTSTTTPSPTTTTSAPKIECKINEFVCLNESRNGNGHCIQFESICDHIVDCTDGSDELQCRCADYLLRDETHRHKLCDGIIDCADLSDETITCGPNCREGMYVCHGFTNQCIEQSKVCDGNNDCLNGDDEQNCIALVDQNQNNDIDSNRIYHHNPNGILYIQHNGQWAPLCFDTYDLDSDNWIDHRYENDSIDMNHNSSISISSMIQIDDMGQAVCKANYYVRLKKINIITSERSNKINEFFAINPRLPSESKPSLSIWSSLFEKTTCPGRKVAEIECSTIECGIRPTSTRHQRRIIGGQSSSYGSWPWQVALYREGEFQCGAVVIDSEWLLTAAHCFYSTPNAFWTARSGVLRRGSIQKTLHEEIRRIDRVFVHPNYVDKGFINDIALLHLERPLKFSKYIRPICLPDKEDSFIDRWNNQLCTTVGWGKLFEHGRIFPDTLQEVTLPIISTQECRKRTLFLPLYKITDNMFCAGYENGGRDACLGDSGGPIMCQKPNGRWILLGITSNGDGCGRAGRPGVYTKVYNYLSWIKLTMSNGYNLNRGFEMNSKMVMLITGKQVDYHPQQQQQQKQEIMNDKSCENGYRCPLGKCLRKEQICDHIIDCHEDSSDERYCSYSYNN